MNFWTWFRGKETPAAAELRNIRLGMTCDKSGVYMRILVESR
jgi:hypothetical protein